MNSNQNSGIPFGFRFNPTEEELISYYLKNKILGAPMMGWESNLIVDAVVYGDNATPWEAFQQFPWQPVVDLMGKLASTERILYVFTRLSNVGKTEKSENKQKNRVAGCGTWHGNTPSQPVFDGNGRGKRVIGHRRTLTFRSKSNQETVGQWTMYEYTIDPVAHGISSGNGFEDLVLCKIKRDNSKSSKGGRIFCRKRHFTSIMHQGQGNEGFSDPYSGHQQHYNYDVNSGHQDFQGETSTNEDHQSSQVSEQGCSDTVALAMEEAATNQEDYNYDGHQYFQGETTTLMIDQEPNNVDYFCSSGGEDILVNMNPLEECLQNPNLWVDLDTLLN